MAFVLWRNGRASRRCSAFAGETGTRPGVSVHAGIEGWDGQGSSASRFKAVSVSVSLRCDLTAPGSTDPSLAARDPGREERRRRRRRKASVTGNEPRCCPLWLER